MNTWTSGELAIFAALIGATSAILAQTIIFLLNRNKEKSNKKKEMIADERKISYLIITLNREFIMHLMHKSYYFRLCEIVSEKKKEKFEKHTLSNFESFKTHDKIRNALSEYIRIISYFSILSDSSKKIESSLNAIKGHKFKPFPQFKDVQSWSDLNNALQEQEENINIECEQFYSKHFEIIHAEMKKKI